MNVHLLGGPLCGTPVELAEPVAGPPERLEFPEGVYMLAHRLPPWVRQWVPGAAYYTWEGLFAGAC